MVFSRNLVPVSFCLLLFTLACGDDDGAIDASGRSDGAPESDAGPGPDSGPSISCMIDVNCPTGLVCDQTTFTCEELDPACSYATCEDNVAASCDGETLVDCSAHGGSCGTFEAEEDGTQFMWCDCGTVPEGGLLCTSDQSAVLCLDGFLGQNIECDPGTTCLDESDGSGDPGCHCDNITDGICPEPSCVDDLDCLDCTPSCGGVVCGDNGCGGSCGSCGLGETCSAGRCASGCAPQCSGRDCGSDGCGGTCGTCGGGESCVDGSCLGECTPSCSGRDCGSDGCGGSCGGCSGSGLCESGLCVASSTCGTGGPCTSPAVCSSPSTGERCVCIGDDQRYTFDGSALDFSGALSRVQVRLRQTYENETSAPLTLESSDFQTISTRILIFGSACFADVEITRIFTFDVDGSVQRCEIGPESYVGQTSFTLTMPSGVGSGCSAPRL